ncbi:MAG: hypothetical protein AAB263_15990, partial [Planctomycetota bacterium]
MPDPIGLGERLALIDHLQDIYQVRPPANANLDQLRKLYREAWEKRQQPAVATTTTDVAAQRDRELRLRRHIADRHGVQADAALDEVGLQRLLRKLDAERAVSDTAEIATRVAEDRERATNFVPEITPEPAATRTAPSATTAASTVPPASAPRAASVSVRHLTFKAAGVSDCVLVTEGEQAALLVLFGADHNGAFADIPDASWACLRTAPSIHRGVLLLGHGTGSTIAGESIETHLKANKAFYETMGDTQPRRAIECLVFASCSASNPDQMRAMRDGLGYFPTWRVATAPRA